MGPSKPLAKTPSARLEPLNLQSLTPISIFVSSPRLYLGGLDAGAGTEEPAPAEDSVTLKLRLALNLA